MVFAIIYLLLEKGILGDSQYYPSTGNPYVSLGNTFIVTVLAAFISGLLVGGIEIFFLNKVFLKRSLGQKIFFKTIIYLAIIFSFLFNISLVNNAIELQRGLLHQEVWNNVWLFLSNFAFWSVELYIASIIGVSLFYAEVSDNLGHGVLNNFFIGKYHTPLEEERIFMFLDMKSSTSIAEHLGHVRYFEMLKEYYADLSEPIITFSGEVYQYVGDEVIVSWKLKNGLNQSNCIRCFFSMKKELKRKEEKYKTTFGIIPTFKAGLHLGKVTTGEIGVIKKDIIFTGDVLNTTARIQGLCNSYDVDILISDQLVKRMERNDSFWVNSLGKKELKGKDERVELFTVQMK